MLYQLRIIITMISETLRKTLPTFGMYSPCQILVFSWKWTCLDTWSKWAWLIFALKMYGSRKYLRTFNTIAKCDAMYKTVFHAKGQGQRSEVKVTEVNTQLSCFRTVTPVWIHIWWWNDAQSLMLLRRGALLFFKVIHQISRSHGSRNRQIWPKLGVSGL